MDDTPPPEDPRRPREKNKPARRDDRDEDRDDTPREGRRRRDEDEEDWDEGERPRRRRRPEPVDDPSLKFLVPLNTSALAIIASYLGLVSVLCLPAPFALLCGVLALRHLKRNPKLDGKGRAIFAIVMGAIFTVPLVIWLVALAANGFK